MYFISCVDLLLWIENHIVIGVVYPFEIDTLENLRLWNYKSALEKCVVLVY